MNKKLVVRYVFWGLTLGIMTFIFIMSSQTRQESSDTSKSLINTFLTLFTDNFKFLDVSQKDIIIQSFQFIVRKGAHFAVYAALGLCSFSAVNTYNLLQKTKFMLSFGICFVYSLTDEIHQMFVDGRAGRLYDIVIDSIGAVAGILIVMLVIFIFKKLKSGRMLNA